MANNKNQNERETLRKGRGKNVDTLASGINQRKCSLLEKDNQSSKDFDIVNQSDELMLLGTSLFSQDFFS